MKDPAADGVFSDKQFQQLVDHLESEFPEYGELLAEHIESDAALYVDWLKKNAATADQLKRWRNHYQQQADAIWTVVQGMHLHGMEGMRGSECERALLYRYDDCLEAIKDNTRPKGSPPNLGRTRLIQAIYQVFGPVNGTKTRDNYFEQTVEMVLRFVEGAPKDIHKTILSALKD